MRTGAVVLRVAEHRVLGYGGTTTVNTVLRSLRLWRCTCWCYMELGGKGVGPTRRRPCRLPVDPGQTTATSVPLDPGQTIAMSVSVACPGQVIAASGFDSRLRQYRARHSRRVGR
eukprot:1590523-Rhodomonas_salina.1